jgi:hypothetical protein
MERLSLAQLAGRVWGVTMTLMVVGVVVIFGLGVIDAGSAAMSAWPGLVAGFKHGVALIDPHESDGKLLPLTDAQREWMSKTINDMGAVPYYGPRERPRQRHIIRRCTCRWVMQ